MKIINLLLISITTILLHSCGSTDEIPYTDIDSVTGFSSAYLNNKTFYHPDSYYGNNFIRTKSFTGAAVTWSDNLFLNEGNAPYSIINVSGINGVIEYNDGVYNLYYNVHSVESDHIKVCYTYSGGNAVTYCDISETLPWYFDITIAESNYPVYP